MNSGKNITSKGVNVYVNRSGVSYSQGDITSPENIEYEQIIKKLKLTSTLNIVSTVLVCFFIFLFNDDTILIGFFAGIIGVAMKIYLLTRGRVVFTYELDDYSAEICKNRVEQWMKLKGCSMLWQTSEETAVADAKRSAGASAGVTRKSIKIAGKPYYIKSNVDIIKLKLQKETIFLMPDKMLIHKGGEYGVVDYNTINYEISTVNFVEQGSVPRDANIINYTWKYVNKNGAPDKRFSDNRQLPVCEYAEIILVSQQGLYTKILCSNAVTAINFGRNI